MALILSIETSAKTGSVAVHENLELLATIELHIGQSHAAQLAPMINQVLRIAGVDVAALDAVAVSAGPGSYTGLRIGVSTAKGLCYANSKPLIAIDTLKLMVAQIREFAPPGALLCPMIDARRMEVYCSVFDRNLFEVMTVESKVIDEHSFADQLENYKVWFFGDGVDKCKAVIHHSNAAFINGVYPRAADMGPLAYDKLVNNQAEDLVLFEPFYLKQFQAKTSV